MSRTIILKVNVVVLVAINENNASIPQRFITLKGKINSPHYEIITRCSKQG
jgi:hypothetical protein